jgi:asparagine synthase (glutamine-hydrolysing)
MTGNPLVVCELAPGDVPELAESVQYYQDEPYGGLPTLAYARLFERAHREGIKVLLDGQGMDEQWAGYDYYAAGTRFDETAVVQGARDRAVRPECLDAEFLKLAEHPANEPAFSDPLRSLQHRDATATKLPRALRFNDRVSMRASTELREPFLDHRLFELAMRQPPERKIGPGGRKWLLRQIARRLLPGQVAEAPKRPLQTPQREWLRGPLAGWATDCIEAALLKHGDAWLDADAVRRAWRTYRDGESDTSLYVWQWINLGLVARDRSSFPAPLQAASAG